MSDRNCLKCKHCHVDTGNQGWSEYTPGDPLDIQCGKNHFRESSTRDLNRKGLRSLFDRAITCQDYEEE